MNKKNKKKSIYIVSDGTGETASVMVRAALVQYPPKNIRLVRKKNIRTNRQIDLLIEDVSSQQGIIIHTLVSPILRKYIQTNCKKKKIKSVDLLGPLLDCLDDHLDMHSLHETGILRAVDEKYFKKIEAIEFTVKYDDGQHLDRLHEAEIILVGISRTSKTPLSIFLSHKGWKVANIPLIYKQPLPPQLLKVDQRKIIGLQIDVETLARIRKKRMENFGQNTSNEYTSRKHIQKEIDYANEFFKLNKRWPIFDITDRALEETASEIIRLIAARMDLPYEVLL